MANRGHRQRLQSLAGDADLEGCRAATQAVARRSAAWSPSVVRAALGQPVMRALSRVLQVPLNSGRACRASERELLPEDLPHEAPGALAPPGLPDTFACLVHDPG